MSPLIESLSIASREQGCRFRLEEYLLRRTKLLSSPVLLTVLVSRHWPQWITVPGFARPAIRVYGNLLLLRAQIEDVPEGAVTNAVQRPMLVCDFMKIRDIEDRELFIPTQAR